MLKNQTHEWHENRERDEGGGKRYFRARWDSREWRFSIMEPEDEDWQRIEQPGLAEFQALHEVLARKYQRRRLPYKYLLNVEERLRTLGWIPNSET